MMRVVKERPENGKETPRNSILSFFPCAITDACANAPAPSDVDALLVLHPDGAEAVIRGFQCSVKP